MTNFKLIDHIQTEIIVINSDMTIIDANEAFQHRTKRECAGVIGEKCFNAAYNFSQYCGYKNTESCPARKSFLTKKPATAIHHFWINGHAVVEELTTTPITDKKGNVKYVIEEFHDLTQLLGLKKGIISVCSYCKKVRNEKGQWVNITTYMQKHTGAKFSHGLCEECYDEALNEFNHDVCKPH